MSTLKPEWMSEEDFDKLLDESMNERDRRNRERVRSMDKPASMPIVSSFMLRVLQEGETRPVNQARSCRDCKYITSPPAPTRNPNIGYCIAHSDLMEAHEFSNADDCESFEAK